MFDALHRRQEVMTNIKRYIFNKRQQHATYVNIRKYLGTELLISLEFSRHYGNLKQNEIQSPCFGNDSFSLFTACLFFKNHDKTKNVHVRITTEGPDKLRVTTISCVDFLIQFLQSEVEKEIDSIHIFFGQVHSTFLIEEYFLFV